MSNIIPIPGREPAERRAIEAEARDWLIRLDGAGPDTALRDELRDWLQRGPYHREAFRQAAAAWGALDTLAALLDESRAGDDGRGRSAAARHGAGGMRAALATLLLALALAAILATQVTSLSPRQPDFSGRYATAVGELRTVTLPDGSHVRLNTDSRMQVAYRADARNIRLIRGEAWFEVRHDRTRPFIVHAGRVAVRAVGTAFSVRLHPDNQVDLTVTEGRVEAASLQEPVASATGIRPAMLEQAVSRVALDQGQHLVFADEIELVQRIAPAAMEKQLSWRDGMLIFDNDSLEKVVSEINRYTPMKIVISDPDLRDLRLGGYFKAGDVASILATFEEGFGIRVEQINPQLVYLSRRRDGD